MTQKPYFNGKWLIKAPSDKNEFIAFARRILDLPPDSTIVDLDDPVNQQKEPPHSTLGIWIDSWHLLANAFGSFDDAGAGIEKARWLLTSISRNFDSMLFSADFSKPPLDCYGPPNKACEMFFRDDTNYNTIEPVAIYQGRKVFLGRK